MSLQHHDGHEVRHLGEIDRRALLKGVGLGLGLVVFGDFIAEAATTQAVKLPGFAAFASSVKVTKNSKYYLVESNGIPAHQMMVGIKSWQEQIPTPQPYSGANAWSIPIKPVLASAPISNVGNFLRGAVAIAVNGIPIFNALNNRGDDAFLAGELDDFGGHCGQADDYHYHTAPLHLQSAVGATTPIAYALDGFAIYGALEPDGSPMAKLDSYNGHIYKKGQYHYHGTATYPYINGGFRGVVTQKDGQVDPQAATHAFRPPQPPLRGALITSCQNLGNGHFILTYTLNGEVTTLDYLATLTTVTLTTTVGSTAPTQQVYQRR
jgi:hypothetical protein